MKLLSNDIFILSKENIEHDIEFYYEKQCRGIIDLTFSSVHQKSYKYSNWRIMLQTEIIVLILSIIFIFGFRYFFYRRVSIIFPIAFFALEVLAYILLKNMGQVYYIFVITIAFVSAKPIFSSIRNRK